MFTCLRWGRAEFRGGGERRGERGSGVLRGENAREAAITYAPGKGQSATRTFHSLELDPPYLYAWTDSSDEVSTFHLGHLRDVDTEAPA
ncbi:hypothetical protein ACIA9I_38175 [Streptomyces anulatus]